MQMNMTPANKVHATAHNDRPHIAPARSQIAKKVEDDVDLTNSSMYGVHAQVVMFRGVRIGATSPFRLRTSLRVGRIAPSPAAVPAHRCMSTKPSSVPPPPEDQEVVDPTKQSGFDIIILGTTFPFP
jgi:hypothetical protein